MGTVNMSISFSDLGGACSLQHANCCAEAEGEGEEEGYGDEF